MVTRDGEVFLAVAMPCCWTWSLFLLKFRNLCLVEILPVVWTGIALGLLLENQSEIFIFLKADLCVFLKPGCLYYNWLLNFGLLLGSNLPSLHTELLINSSVPAEEILSREDVEKHLLLCLKLLLVVLVTNLWGDLSTYWREDTNCWTEFKSMKRSRTFPTKKTHILFQIFLLFSLIPEVVKKRSSDTEVAFIT